MNHDDFASLRAQRPDPQPPSDEVIRLAKEELMQRIQDEHSQPAPVVSSKANWGRRVRIGLAAATIAAVAGVGAVVAVTNHGPNPPSSISAQATPQQALESAARLVSYSQPAAGPIRHIRFRNETDPGDPTFDAYIRPNGSAMVGKAGGPLVETDGYLPTAELANLPSDPTNLRAAMTALAVKHGYGLPGQVEERALFRLAVDLLSDPGVSDGVKAGAYRVIAGFNLAAVRAKSLGMVEDAAGRPGIGLQFHFEEDANEVLVISQATGTLLSDTTTLSGGQPFSGQTYLLQENVSAIPTSAASR